MNKLTHAITVRITHKIFMYDFSREKDNANHFGMNPKRGGIPPKERNKIILSLLFSISKTLKVLVFF